MKMEMDEDLNRDVSDKEYSFLHRPKVWPRNLSFNNEQEECRMDFINIVPSTPPSMSDSASDFSLTPLPSMECDDVSYQKLQRVDGNMNKPRLTSTPITSSPHSCSLPTPFNRVFADPRHCRSFDNVRLYRIGSEELPLEYMNPFTPDGKLLLKKANAQKQLKRLSILPKTQLHLNDNVDCDEQSFESDKIDVPERRRLSEFNVSRFKQEFVEIMQIGKGYQGCVFKCVNRMNGCLYAIKRTLNPIKSGTQEKVVRNEIYAHGILDHQNIVRNFSCWKEEGYVYIQNEYCNGGNLENYIQVHQLSEAQLRSLLLQMAHALRHLHGKGLVHMDIKPENILLSLDNNQENIYFSNEGVTNIANGDIIFKLGDLGHVTRIDEDKDVEEGDCRFLPVEILKMKYGQLDKADIFSLGLTVYSAAGGGSLPKNGVVWHQIREGNIKYLENVSKEFNDIIKVMIDISPEKRPTAVELIQMLKTDSHSPPHEVFDQIHKYELSTCVLKETVEKTGHYLRVLAKTQKQLQEQLKELPNSPSKNLPGNGVKKRGPALKTRIVGKKTKRSSSTTLF